MAGVTYPQGLLDTSVVIDLQPGELTPHIAVACVAVITLAELAFGLHTADPVVNAAREARYHRIQSTFAVIGFDPAAARVYGALCENVRVAGRGPRPRRFDMLIAATAVSRGLPLLTRNPGDFLGLRAALTVIPL